MFRNGVIAALLFAAGALAAGAWAAGAGDAPPPAAGPKSPQAVAAVRKRDKAVDEAERAYRAAVLAAERQAVDDLKAAQAAAMKANNLPEANAIDAAVKAAQARIDALQRPKAAAELEARVLRQRAYRYGHWEGNDFQVIVLDPGGKVRRTAKEGGADTGLAWSVRGDAAGRERLVLTDEHGSLEFREDDAHNFHGRRAGEDRDLVLLPVAAPG